MLNGLDVSTDLSGLRIQTHQEAAVKIAWIMRQTLLETLLSHPETPDSPYQTLQCSRWMWLLLLEILGEAYVDCPFKDAYVIKRATRWTEAEAYKHEVDR